MTYTPAFSPYAHQTVALHRIIHRPDWPAPTDVFALLMEMGTGKTKVILDEFGQREDARDCRNLLVIAPKGGYLNWAMKEIPEHLDPGLRERTLVLAWVSGGGASYKRRVASFLAAQDYPRILLVNVEALSSASGAKALCLEYVRQRRTIVVVDESTRIKGLADKTARVKATIEIGAKAYARRICTGLVTPRSPLDLYSQFEFLDYRILGFRSFYAFKARYAITQTIEVQGDVLTDDGGTILTDINGDVIRKPGREVNIVVGYRHEEELKEKIAPYSYRVLKSECLDLPEKIWTSREVELTDEQHRILGELQETAQAELAGGAYVSTVNRMNTLMRMHQVVCGFTKDEEGRDHVIPSNRISAMMELLEESEGKVIIWTGHVAVLVEIIRAIRKVFGENSVVDFYGGTREKLRNVAVARFQGDPTCRFFVSNPQSGSTTITLTAASQVIYVSNTWSLEDRMQSEDRAHRAGLKHAVTYTDLIATGTIDTKIVNALRKKLDLATMISGDDYREWLI